MRYAEISGAAGGCWYPLSQMLSESGELLNDGLMEKHSTGKAGSVGRAREDSLTSNGCLLWSAADVEELVSLSVFLCRKKSTGKLRGCYGKTSLAEGSEGLEQMPQLPLTASPELCLPPLPPGAGSAPHGSEPTLRC